MSDPFISERRYWVPPRRLGDGWHVIAKAPLPEEAKSGKKDDDVDGLVEIVHIVVGLQTAMQWDEAVDIAHVILRAARDAGVPIVDVDQPKRDGVGR